MTNPETKLAKRILLAASQEGYTLFRNQVGAGWAGDWTRLKDGSVLIRNPRFVRYGLYPGSGDFIGWRMVDVASGVMVPVFASIEIKTAKGRQSEDQKKWQANLKKAGAIALVARRPEDLSIE